MPATIFDPGGCGCSGTCTTTIGGNVQGCSNINAPGITVEAHDATAGGTLLASATTDGSGNYTLPGFAAVSGNDIVLVFSLAVARFAPATKTFTFKAIAGAPSSTQWKCSNTTAAGSTTLTPATDYHCISGCAFPIYKDLPYTSSILGGGTLHWAGGTVWSTVLSSSSPACGGCAGGPTNITVSMDCGANAGGVGFWSDGAPFSGCPGTVAQTSSGWGYVGATRVCPESGTFSITKSITQVFSIFDHIAYVWHGCVGAAVPETIIITE
jgi:hypothetical protein